MTRGWLPIHSALLALLLVACIGLGAIVYGELTSPPDANPETLPAQPGPAQALPATGGPKAFSLPPFQAFSETSQRPLFSQNRQPPQAPKQVAQTSSFALHGVIITAAERVALIQHGRPPTLTRVKEGQDIEGWTVRTILPDHIVLQNGATESEIKLLDKAVPRPPTVGGVPKP